MFKVNDKDTRMTYFTPCSSVSFINFEQVNAASAVPLTLYTQHINPSSHSVAFHIETSHLICNANPMTGFCVKFYQTG